MSLPRMQPQDGVAWITGASSGIGEAVALALAQRGWTVVVTARRLDQLEEMARRSEDLPGRIVAHAGDVTDAPSMQVVVDGIESVHGPIALAFLNAGIAAERQDGILDLAAFEQVFAVNLFGTVNSLAPVLERMKARGRGQIAVNASIAGYGGLPKAAAYGASKAALINLCEALHFDCEPLGIRLQLVSPGFVDTPLTRRNAFPMPFLITVEAAAERIVTGFEHGGFEISFPKRLSWIMKAANRLPYAAYFRLIGWIAGRDRR